MNWKLISFSCFAIPMISLISPRVYMYFTMLSFWPLQLVRCCFVEPTSANGSMLQRFCLWWKCTGIEILPSCDIIGSFHNCQASWKLSFIFLVPSSGQLWLTAYLIPLSSNVIHQKSSSCLSWWIFMWSGEFSKKGDCVFHLLTADWKCPARASAVLDS